MKSASRFKSIQKLAASLFLSLAMVSAFASNPIPTVVGPVVPQAVVPGNGAFTLKVYGSNFVAGAVVNWNRSARATTFISAHELEAQILASDVAKATAGNITVTNPPPGGGVSSASFSLVEVHTPTATIVVGRPNVYLRNIGAQLLVLSDFNNDGIFDFATNYSFSSIIDLLGNGDGTFGHSSIAGYGYYGSGPAAIASGDFNNDGNEDLVYGANPNGPPWHLQVALGNGDGRFRKGSRFGEFQRFYPTSTLVGDFNRDGKLDLFDEDDAASVFLGNGDGTFRKGPPNKLVGGFATVAADFNGDGKLDLASVGSNYLEVALGNGDGTFQKSRVTQLVHPPKCSFGQPFFVTDFNADGIPDLAFCERGQTNGTIWIMIGKGDGTFKKPVAITVPAQQGAFTFTVGDFNSDGKTDLLANYNITNALTENDLFLGNGDGTFQHKKVIKLPGAPNYNAELGLVPADLNSDGLLDFIFQQPGDVSVFVQK